MNKQVSYEGGYMLIAVGFLLIFMTVAILTLALNNSGNDFWISFYHFWFQVVSFCLITGAFFVVIGAVYLFNIRHKWSYASITVGFSLIVFEVTELAVTLQGTQGPGGIGWGYFQEDLALGFFSGLMAACFFIVLGIILGLKFRNKLGYVIIIGGVAIMLVGASILAANLATSLNYYPPDYYFSLRLAWNATISYFLIIGLFTVVAGAGYFIVVRRRNRIRQN
jgi:hypothetical protein